MSEKAKQEPKDGLCSSGGLTKEKAITAAIMRELKTVPDCFCWKQHGGIHSTAGLPDIICCIGGRFVAFEVKTPHGKLTKLQESTIRKIKDAKGEAYKVTSLQEVKEILSKLNS
jgi:hypothetical protein